MEGDCASAQKNQHSNERNWIHEESTDESHPVDKADSHPAEEPGNFTVTVVMAVVFVGFLVGVERSLADESSDGDHLFKILLIDFIDVVAFVVIKVAREWVLAHDSVRGQLGLAAFTNDGLAIFTLDFLMVIVVVMMISMAFLRPGMSFTFRDDGPLDLLEMAGAWSLHPLCGKTWSRGRRWESKEAHQPGDESRRPLVMRMVVTMEEEWTFAAFFRMSVWVSVATVKAFIDFNHFGVY